MYDKYNRVASFDEPSTNYDEENFYNDEYEENYEKEYEEDYENDSNLKFNNGISYGSNYYDFELANILERGVAFIIDFIIFILVHLSLIYVYSRAFVPYIQSSVMIFIGVMLIFFISTSFNGLFIPLFINRGQTIGKIIVRIKTTTPECYDVQSKDIILKYLLGFLFLIDTYLLLFSNDSKTIYQRINESIVIRLE